MLNPELDLSLNTESSEKPKKQKLVKHKRKNWKKTDITEIEQGHDDLKQQELTGGVRADKKDDELFFINKKKLEINQEGDLVQPNTRPKRLTLEEKLSNMKCYQNLSPDPNSLPIHLIRPITKADPNSKRQLNLNERKAKKMKRNLLAKKRENSYCAQLANEIENNDSKNENIDSSVTKRKKKSNKLDSDFKENFSEKKLNVHLETNFDKDIWKNQIATDGSDLPALTITNEHFLRGLKKVPIVKPNNPLYKESLIQKVETPHPGHSYNPDYDDHQALLLKAHLVELKKLKEEQKLMRRLALSAKKMSWVELEKRWLEEMSVRELFEPKTKEDENNNDSDFNESAEETVISKRELRRRYESVNNGRKTDTKVKRDRKKLLEKIKLRQKETLRLMKIQQNEIYRLKTLKKEVDAKLKKENESALHRKEEITKKELLGQKRLGRLKFEEEELELKLSEEITGNLRSLKPEGNIMRDRYKSFQKRNIIEPREKAKGKNKYSKKKFQKRNAYEVTHYIN